MRTSEAHAVHRQRDRALVQRLLERRAAALSGLAVTVVAVLVYANTAWNDFAFDDEPLIRANPAIREIENIPGFFISGQPGPGPWASFYRPMSLASLAVDHSMWGLRPAGYHVTNVALHAAVSVIALILLFRLTKSRGVAFAAALLFAAHAVHTEAVANAIGRAELLGALFFLIALWLYVRQRQSSSSARLPIRLAMLGSYALALFSKENTITLLGVLLLYDFVYQQRGGLGLWESLRRVDWRSRAIDYGGFAMVSAGVLALHLFAVGSPIGRRAPLVDNPLAHLATPERIINAFLVSGRYVWLLLWPQDLACDYSYDTIPMSKSALAVGSTLCLVVLAAWLAVRAYRTSKPLFFAAGFTITTLSVVSNIAFPIGTILGERLLYLPSFGFCLAAALAMEWTAARLARRSGSVRLLFVTWVVVAVAMHGGRAVVRNRDWASDRTLFLHDVQVSARSVKLQDNAGRVLQADGQFAASIPHFEAAIRILPEQPSAWTNLAYSLAALGRRDEATRILEEQLHRHPESPRVLNNVGYYLVEYGLDVARGTRLIEEAVHSEPSNADFLDSLGWGYFKLGRLVPARAALGEALRIAPAGPAAALARTHLREVERVIEASGTARGTGSPDVQSKLSPGPLP